MSLRSLVPPLLASCLLAATAAADRLLVAGADGFVYQADTSRGVFQYFACQCGGPINALAADRDRLYAADEWSNLLVFDVNDGALQASFPLPAAQINALAARDGVVYAGTEASLVLTIDAATGAVLASRTTPAGVRALRLHGNFLLAGGADGAVYRAPVAAGEFTYFTCFCFSGIQDIVVDGDGLVVGDQFGTTARVNAMTGGLMTAFWTSPMNALAVQGGDLLVHAGSGAILRFDSATGASLPGGYASPIDVRTMLVLPGEPSAPAPPLLPRAASPLRRP